MTSARPASRRSRRVLVLGVLVSLALHLVLVAVLQRALQLPPGGVSTPQVAVVLLPELTAAVAPPPASLALRAPAPPPVPLPPPPELPPLPASAPPSVPASTEPAVTDGVDDAHQIAAAPVSTGPSAAALADLLARQPRPESAGAAPDNPGGAGAAPVAGTAAALPEPVASALARMPQQGEVDYQVSMGGDWQVARGTLRWRIDGIRYHVDLTAQAVGLARLLKSNAVSQISEGHITASGLAPDQFRVLGRTTDNGEENARFDWSGGQLTFQPSGQSLALPEGTQDLLSFFMQFALVPPHTDSVLQAVTNGRKLDRYTFEMTERGPLHLPVGVFDTVHITKLHAANEDDFDVWLAQDRHYLPVQMRFRARGRLLTLSAIAIRVAGLHSAL